MRQRIIVGSGVADRLQDATLASKAHFLIGVRLPDSSPPSILVTASAHCAAPYAKTLSDTRAFLPAGISVLGASFPRSTERPLDSVDGPIDSQVWNAVVEAKRVDAPVGSQEVNAGESDSLVVVLWVHQKVLSGETRSVESNGPGEAADVSVVSDEEVAALFNRDFVPFRCELKMRLNGELSDWKKQIDKTLLSPGLCVAYPDGLIAKINKREGDVDMNASKVCQVYFSGQQTGTNSASSIKTPAKKSSKSQTQLSQSAEALGKAYATPVELKLFVSQSLPSDKKPAALILSYSKETASAPKSQRTIRLHVIQYSHLSSTLESQVLSLKKSLVAQAKVLALMASVKNLAEPTYFVYKFPHVPHLMTISYPTIPKEKATYADISEENTFTYRQNIHMVYQLPMDRPLVRMTNAINFDALSSTSGRLLDVHIGLGSSGVAGGTQYLVQGSYDYYHYMQDRFDDKGWGCAYRSLQTICSWFLHQNYTGIPVPDHLTIQQTLVRIGDKEQSFIGSKNWIGALEVNMCLDTLYGVTCKILSVSSGAQLAEKGRELSRHFLSQGTPIMIGGGVLAYTLLGIDFNEQTGDIAFLILDPHYTGSEDLHVIQSKKWCAWHKADLFVKEAFYNLCMPQRPHII